MTVHEHAQRVLSAGVDGEANADDLALATSHVERCVECQRAAGGFAKVVEATRRLLPGTSPGWIQSLPETLPEQLPVPAGGGTSPAGVNGVWRPSAPAGRPSLGRRSAGSGGATRDDGETVGLATLLATVEPVDTGPLDPSAPPTVAVPSRPEPPPRAGASSIVAKGLSAVTWIATVGAACLLVLMAAAWVRDRLQPAAAVPTATAVTDVHSSATVAVRSWAQAVVAGNADGAWSLLSPRARDAVGGRAGFDERLPELRKRYRSLLERAGGTERAVLLAGGDSQVRSVVILAADGGPAAAVPVVTAGGTSLVEPFEPAISLEVRRSGRDVVVAVEPAAATIRVVIDDGGPVMPTRRSSPGGSSNLEQVVTVRAGLDHGSHVVVAAAIDAEGRIAARAVVFEVA
jgi:hypothetical protein